MAASTDVVDFGSVQVGQSAERTVYLVNSGDSSLKLQPPQGDTVGSVFAALLIDSEVPPTQDAVLRVVFAPGHPESYETQFAIANNSSNEPQFRLTTRGSGYVGDPCFGKSCQTPPSQCFYGQGECKNGYCVYPPNDSAACNDTDFCTLADTCLHGSCGGAAKVCGLPPLPFCFAADTLRIFEAVGTCMPQTGECTYAKQDVFCEFGCQNRGCLNDPCAGGCDDGNACTKDTCGNGGCLHAPLDGTGCVAPSGKCPVGVCAGGTCLSRSGEVCSTTIEVDLCGDIDVAGVCTGAGSCVVEEAPPQYTCPPGTCSSGFGLCVSCTPIPGITLRYVLCF